MNDLIDRYRTAAIGTSAEDVFTANKWHDELHECFKLLRDTEQGRKAISDLVTDADPYIKFSAAAHSLQWAPEIARSVLKRIIEEDGSCSFDAQVTLQEFDLGRLSFDF